MIFGARNLPDIRGVTSSPKADNVILVPTWMTYNSTARDECFEPNLKVGLKYLLAQNEM